MVRVQKKWIWKGEPVEMLTGFIKDFKTTCDFNGIDFEADLKTLYSTPNFAKPWKLFTLKNLLQKR